MPSAARTQDVPFLPPAWAAMLKRTMQVTAGVVVLAMCAAMGLALISYVPTDPSLNTATPLPPLNAMRVSCSPAEPDTVPAKPTRRGR